jgi:pimeloyl-ACP methyl ester carboxylesterase
MSFPIPWTVQQEDFTGTGEDDLGNDTGTWGSPHDVQVICYQSSMVESVNGYTSRVVSDIDMAVPPELAVSVRDRFILPDEARLDPAEPARFEVVAIEDANHGFHQWQPGSVVKLKRVTG